LWWSSNAVEASSAERPEIIEELQSPGAIRGRDDVSLSAVELLMELRLMERGTVFVPIKC
jgi:hypothetical protein